VRIASDCDLTFIVFAHLFDKDPRPRDIEAYLILRNFY